MSKSRPAPIPFPLNPPWTYLISFQNEDDRTFENQKSNTEWTLKIFEGHSTSFQVNHSKNEEPNTSDFFGGIYLILLATMIHLGQMAAATAKKKAKVYRRIRSPSWISPDPPPRNLWLHETSNSPRKLSLPLFGWGMMCSRFTHWNNEGNNGIDITPSLRW